ncbi:MAG: hypothetical protein II021_05720, partial [Oscillospiraceae bacterium]|nr:hypothetical protein [Oscillospiraceae bacterium]
MPGFAQWLTNNRELKNEEPEKPAVSAGSYYRQTENETQPVAQSFAQWAGSDRGAKILAQSKAASDWKTYGADYESWIDDVNAFGKNAYEWTQSWKDAGTASVLVSQNKESASALKKRGQGIYNFFTNYADDIDAANGAGTAKSVLDSITSAQKGLDGAQSYVDYVTQSWAAAPDAETYGTYQEWAQNPRSVEEIEGERGELAPRAKGFYDYALRDTQDVSDEYYAHLEKSKKFLEDRLTTLRQELKFRQDNETYEKQQKWKENPRSSEEVMRDIEELAPRVKGFYDYALKDAQDVSDEYYGHLSETHKRLENELSDLNAEYQYRKWAEYAKYSESPDFAEKSQYTPTGFGKEDINYAPKLDYFTALVLSGFNPAAADLLYNGSQLLNPDDADRDREVTYGLVNRDAAAFTQNFANKAPNEVLLGQIPTDGIEYYQMSPDERATYNYLYATDKTKADEYMEWLYPQLTERQRDAETKAVHDWTQESTANAIVGNVASVLASPLKALSYGSQVADLINTGKIDENAGYNRYSYLNNAV